MARFFDGTNDTITVDDVAGVRAQRPMSGSAWIRRSSSLGSNNFFWKRGDTNKGWAFRIAPTADNRVALTFFGIADVFSTSTITDQLWHHIAFTIDASGNIRIYIDGVLDLTSTISAPSTTTQILRIAQSTDDNGVPTTFKEQTSAESAIWSSQLSGGQVLAVFNGKIGVPATINPSTLELYLPFEGLESPEPDLSGNKRTGTVTGAIRANGPPIAPHSARFWGDGPLVEAAGGIDYTLAADAGAFVLTGVAAGLVKGYVIPADAGAHSMAGTAASLILGRKVAADGGAFAMAGQDAALSWAASLGAVAGSFALAGQDADLILGYVLAAIGGAYDLAGQDAGLVIGSGVAADGGSFDLAGSDAGLILGRNVAADGGAFAMVGTDAGLAWAAKLAAAAGAYTFEGQDADLLHAIISGLAAVLFPPNVVDASPRRWKVDAEREWKASAPARRFRVDDDL